MAAKNAAKSARTKPIETLPEPEPVMPVAENAPAPEGMPDNTEEGDRSGFGTRLGFILAAIGSAVGFGSIARFPMNAANQGGAVFLVMYLLIMVLIGIPMMVAEFSLGRSAQKNTVGAFRVLTGNQRTKWTSAGYLFFILAGFILSYYAVLTGWTLRYFFGSFTGAYFDDPDAYFSTTEEGPVTLLWLAIVMVTVALVLTGKVSKGIEKVSFIMMPALFAIIIGLAIYAAFLPGVGSGYAYYLTPDVGKLQVPVFAAAIGQAFFSLSLFQGAMMVYASYIPKTSSLASNATIISVSTLSFATLCGLMIFPLMASFGIALNPETPAGLGLIFGPLAQTFAQMGTPLGQIIGGLFFLATFFAAFTSAVSLAEPGIAYIIEEHGIDRRRASILVCGVIYIFGLVSAFSGELLNLAGGALTNAAVMLGGLVIAIYVGWFSPMALARQRMDESEKGLKISRLAYPLIRYVMPAVLAVLLFFELAGTPCVLTGDEAARGVIEQFIAYFNPESSARVLGCTG